MLPSELTNTIVDVYSYLCRPLRSSEWSTLHLHLCISYQCIWGWQHLQKTSPNVISPIFFAIYISLWGSTHDSADYWSAHRSLQLSATTSNVCTTDARLCGVGRVPPQTKSMATPVWQSKISDRQDINYDNPRYWDRLDIWQSKISDRLDILIVRSVPLRSLRSDSVLPYLTTSLLASIICSAKFHCPPAVWVTMVGFHTALFFIEQSVLLEIKCWTLRSSL